MSYQTSNLLLTVIVVGMFARIGRISNMVIVALHTYSPPCDVRSGLKVRYRVLVAPDTVLVSVVLVPLTSTLPSFIHATSGTTTSPSTIFTVHTSEYTDPAIELPDDAVTTGGGRAGGKR